MNINEMESVTKATFPALAKKFEEKGIQVKAEFENDSMKRLDFSLGGNSFMSIYQESYNPRYMIPKVAKEKKFLLKGTILRGAVPISIEFKDEREAEKLKDYLEESGGKEDNHLEVEEINKEVAPDAIPF